MIADSAFLSALNEERRRSLGEIVAAQAAGDEQRRATALERLADLQEILHRTMDAVALGAGTTR